MYAKIAYKPRATGVVAVLLRISGQTLTRLSIKGLQPAVFHVEHLAMFYCLFGRLMYACNDTLARPLKHKALEE